jgi:hypothetical protein
LNSLILNWCTGGCWFTPAATIEPSTVVRDTKNYLLGGDCGLAASTTEAVWFDRNERGCFWQTEKISLVAREGEREGKAVFAMRERERGERQESSILLTPLLAQCFSWKSDRTRNEKKRQGFSSGVRWREGRRD